MPGTPYESSLWNLLHVTLPAPRICVPYLVWNPCPMLYLLNCYQPCATNLKLFAERDSGNFRNKSDTKASWTSLSNINIWLLRVTFNNQKIEQWHNKVSAVCRMPVYLPSYQSCTVWATWELAVLLQDDKQNEITQTFVLDRHMQISKCITLHDCLFRDLSSEAGVAPCHSRPVWKIHKQVCPPHLRCMRMLSILPAQLTECSTKVSAKVFTEINASCTIYTAMPWTGFFSCTHHIYYK
jgi:hypothetical protein